MLRLAKFLGYLMVFVVIAAALIRFANPTHCTETLSGVGFSDIEIQKLPLSWQPDSPEDVLELILKSTVRTPALLEHQSQDVRSRIEKAILEGTENHRRSGKIEIAFPAAMVTETKPD